MSTQTLFLNLRQFIGIGAATRGAILPPPPLARSVPKFNKNFKFVRFSGGFALLFLLSALSCGRENLAGGPSDIETYDFTLSDSAAYNFPGGVENVYSAATHEVIITNTGSLETGVISIGLSATNAFELSETSLASIAPGGDASFSVSTIEGLTGDTYTATITASGEGSFQKQCTVSFTVGDPTLELSIVGGAQLDFGQKIAGYAAAPDAQEVTVENTGNQPLTGVAVVIGQTKYSASPSTADLAVGERIAFAVKPIMGLASSDWTAALTVGAVGGVAPAEFDAAFSVRNGTIKAQTVQNGSIAVDVQSAVPGTVVTLTASPDNGYALSKTIQPNTITYTRLNATQYRFSMPSGADVDLTGSFIDPTANKMAIGGEVNVVNTGGGTFKEVHRFTYNSGNDVDGQTPYTLDFSGTVSGLSAMVIVSAGGGGGGGSSGTGDGGGGGGAGGLIYNENYTINGDITVKVGKGGAGGISEENHANATAATEGVSGKNSQFDSLNATGGGGGGGGFNNRYNGKNGGSGGGGGSGTSNGTAGSGSQGYAGGVATVESSLDAGGGGGGAGGAGQNGGNGPGGAGGAGRTITGIPHWSSLTLCRGGNGGTSSASELPPPVTATFYGEGGAAGPAGNSTPIGKRAGAPGIEGLVVVWWDYIAP